MFEPLNYSSPDLVGRKRAVRDHETVPAKRTPDGSHGLYRLTSERIRRKTREDIEGERLAADNERAHRPRHVYEAIGLAVTAHKNETLLLRWSIGGRALPAVTGSESSVLGSIFRPEAPR